MFLADHPWKTDDAAWFKANPGRSHRLRPVLKGEAETFHPEVSQVEMPPDHRIEVLVRQVKPGVRARIPFVRDMSIEIPDEEGIIHSIFDTVANMEQAQHIDMHAIMARARQYKGAQSRPVH